MRKLFCHVLGDGPPLVLLHGLFGSHDNLGLLGRMLAQHYRVLLPDLRNHGQSFRSPTMSYEAMATDLETLLDSEHLDQVSLAGHSMGGKVAMQFSLTRAGRVSKLVVLDISPKAYPPKHDAILRALLALELNQFQTRREMEEALAPEIPDLSVRRFLLKNVRRTEAGPFIWRLDLRAIAENYGEISAGLGTLGPWRGPALFLRGERSDYIQDSDYAQITQVFPQAQFATINGAQHWLHADAPQDVIDRITRFLGE